MSTDAQRHDSAGAPPSGESAGDGNGDSARVLRAVTCPFCGLVCDDLDVAVSAAEVRVVANGCVRSRGMFHEALPRSPTPAWIAGEAVALDAALDRAAAILREAVQPVFGGLATDVAGVRACLELADRLGAIVDHLGSRAFMRNVLTLQQNGWITTTFAEVRNRADLIIVAGTDVVSRFPRFFERVVFGDAMFVREEEREIVFVGAQATTDAATTRAGRAPRVIKCENRALGEIFGALQGILSGTLSAQTNAGGVPPRVLRELADRMRNARYGVLVWAVADLDFPHAEITVEAMCACVRALNEHTRFAALPLGGNDADTTAQQVCLWQTGFPLRVSFAGGAIDYDPHRYAAENALASGGGDALLWITSFDAERAPPRTSVPTILLGRPGPRVSAPPDVEIAVATPGLDHAGQFYRGDGVVAMRLRRLVDSPLPTVADVIRRIGSAL